MAAGFSTQPGYRNPNGQTVEARTTLSGNHGNQRVYAMRCGDCSERYGDNGCDTHLRRCPNCQRGKEGLALA